MLIGKEIYYLFAVSVFYPPSLLKDNTRIENEWKGLDRKRILNDATVLHEQGKQIRKK
jgi:hypothetical protein